MPPPRTGSGEPFMIDVLEILVGIGFGLLVAIWLAWQRPEWSVLLKLSPPTLPPARLPPAVEQALGGTTAVTPEEVQGGAAKKIRDPDLRQLVELLAGERGQANGWAPLRHQDEYRFQDSFEKFLLKRGYSHGDIRREELVTWRGAEASADKRHARPDFIVRERILVEIKRNVTASGTSDRALGQVLRYLGAWADRGPVLLLVCNECDRHLRDLIKRHIRSWQSLGAPVMAYFVRTDSRSEAMADVPHIEQKG